MEEGTSDSNTGSETTSAQTEDAPTSEPLEGPSKARAAHWVQHLSVCEPASESSSDNTQYIAQYHLSLSQHMKSVQMGSVFKQAWGKDDVLGWKGSQTRAENK